ncbi:MAG: hypothetical protein U0132_02300 [Gemmatimonadaceae bacterium]
MTTRTDFPVFSAGYSRAAGDAPVMLDGMEVLFDKTVGLAPVTLEPKAGKPAEGPTRDGPGGGAV